VFTVGTAGLPNFFLALNFFNVNFLIAINSLTR